MKYAKLLIALPVAGSAISLLSCSAPRTGSDNDDDVIVSRTVHNMDMVDSKNGLRSMLMRSPLLEEHAFADPAYTEYPHGIDLTGYDSLGVNPASRIVSDYALHWTALDRWQLTGNVVAEGEKGERLYTQQLYYDVGTEKIWSNVDCKFERGDEVFVGEGFDALKDFRYAAVRNITGYFNVEEGTGGAQPADDPDGAQSADGTDGAAHREDMIPEPPALPALPAISAKRATSAIHETTTAVKEVTTTVNEATTTVKEAATAVREDAPVEDKLTGER